MMLLSSFFEVNFASIVALVVAVISGVFSFIIAKRNTKPQMVQHYFDYLQKKVDILAGYIDHKRPDLPDLDMTKKEDQLMAAEAFRKEYEYYDSIFTNESSLFTECKAQYDKLLPEREAIDESRTFLTFSLKYGDKPDMVKWDSFGEVKYKGFYEVYGAMKKFAQDVENLLKAERAATLKLFRDLSLK